MPDQAQSLEQYSLWVLILKNKHWIPDSKFGGGAFSTALARAEDLDHDPDNESVKVTRVANSGGREQKEMWVSSRMQDRSAAARANQLSTATQASATTMSPRRTSS